MRIATALAAVTAVKLATGFKLTFEVVTGGGAPVADQTPDTVAGDPLLANDGEAFKLAQDLKDAVPGIQNIRVVAVTPKGSVVVDSLPIVAAKAKP